MSAATSDARKRLEESIARLAGRTIPLPATADRAERARVWHEAARMARESASRVGWKNADAMRCLTELADHFEERATAEGVAS